MGVITERLAVIIDAQAGGAIKEFDRLSGKAQKAGADAGGLSGLFQKAGFSAETAGKAAVFATAGVAVGVGALAAGATAAVGAFLGLADSVRSTQRVIGGSAEDASKVVAEFTRFGIASEDANKGLFKFARTLGDTPEKLTAFGVGMAKNKDGTVNVAGTLRNLGEVYRSTSDSTQKAALVQAAFGRAGLALIPILTATKEQLAAVDSLARSRGQILTQEDLEKARDFKVGIAEVKEEAKGLLVTAGKGILTKIAGEPGDFAIGLNALRRFNFGFGDSLQKSKEAAAYSITQSQGQRKNAAAVQEHTDAIEKQTKASRELISAVLAETSAQQSVASARLAEQSAVRAVSDAKRDAASFSRRERDERTADLQSIQDATFGVVDAQQREADASRHLTDVERDLQDGTTGAAAAQRDLRRATLDNADAQDRLAEAQKRYDDLLSPSLATQEDAAFKVKEAQQGVADAIERVAEAQQRVNQSKTPEDRRRAQNALDKANLDVEKSSRALTKAQEDEQRALGVGTEAAKDREKADHDLQRAKLDAEDATLRQQAAQRDADNAAAEGARTIQRAVDDVSRAHRDVVKSVDAVGKANQKLADDDATRGDQQKQTTEKVAGAENALLAAKNGVVSAIIGAQTAQETLNKLLEDPKSIDAAVANLQPLVDKNRELADLLDRLGRAGSGGGSPISANQLDHRSASTGGAAFAGLSGSGVIILSLDGKVLAEVVTQHQERSQQQGGSRTRPR